MNKSAEPVDVLIVGAGAAGAVFAATLAASGKRVLLLERGGPRKPADLYSSQIWARRLKWGAPSVQDGGPDSAGVNFNMGQGVGGAAVHHYAVWPRFHADDFQLQREFGRGRDWPIGYDLLRPYYDEIQREVGLSGDAAAEVWRPPGAPYPLPAVFLGRHGQTLASGFEALGMRTAPLPMAILSRPYKNRPACQWDGWCDAGCPTGALANPLVVYLPQARQHGAQIRTGCQVVKVLTNARGDRVTGVEYVDATHRRHRQRASLVVLAANNLETARLLLASASAAHPNGLANASRQVGRGLMTHGAVLNFGMFDKPIDNHLGVSGGQLLNQDSWKKDAILDAFGSRSWLIGNALKANDLLGIAMSRPDVYGDALHAFLREGATRLSCMNAVCEDERKDENRLELGTGQDAAGMPLARVTYRRSADASRLALQAAAQGDRICKAAGATSAWHSGVNAMHILGGTVMGREPADSVANAEGQAHELCNLYFGGSGLFASSSAVNPTFTVHALALKSARHVVRHWAALVV